MSQGIDGRALGKYTLELKLKAKLEVFRLAKGGQAVPMTAKVTETLLAFE